MASAAADLGDLESPGGDSDLGPDRGHGQVRGVAAVSRYAVALQGKVRVPLGLAYPRETLQTHEYQKEA